MRFNIEEIENEFLPRQVLLGDVYAMKGGRNRGVWVVVGLRNRMAYVLGIGDEGDVISAQSYGLHAFEEREPIGRCDDVEGMTFNISKGSFRSATQ